MAKKYLSPFSFKYVFRVLVVGSPIDKVFFTLKKRFVTVSNTRTTGNAQNACLHPLYLTHLFESLTWYYLCIKEYFNMLFPPRNVFNKQKIKEIIEL